jgi:hypothetical protein
MYGCYNKPRPTNKSTYVGQDGWLQIGLQDGLTRHQTRLPKLINIPHAMTKDCQYSKTTVDAGCDGCVNKAKV